MAIVPEPSNPIAKAGKLQVIYESFWNALPGTDAGTRKIALIGRIMSLGWCRSGVQRKFVRPRAEFWKIVPEKFAIVRSNAKIQIEGCARIAHRTSLKVPVRDFNKVHSCTSHVLSFRGPAIIVGAVFVSIPRF